MDKLVVSGPSKLQGSIKVSSAKNATLPLLTACLLFEDQITFESLPDLNDVKTLIKLLESMGVVITRKNQQITVDARSLKHQIAEYQLVKTMRASVLVLGPLLARFHQAKVSLPGGCAIGARPVDIHLKGMEDLGALIEIENGYIVASTKGLKGKSIVLSFPSVGATENLMMAACLAEGVTTIENAAREPEIVDLARFLNFHGCQVTGAGTSRIEIVGQKAPLKSNSKPYQVIGDRIEAATYIIAALMSQAHVDVTGFQPDDLASVLEVLEKMGAKLKRHDQGVEVFPSGRLKGAIIETAPFPGFPTDVQAQMMALMTIAEGNSVITEHIFENRYMHVPELIRMGAKIQLKGSTALIEGVPTLKAAPVMCTDLRASAALVLCALVAEGQTDILRVYHLDRGYEKLDRKLQQLGAKIQRVKE